METIDGFCRRMVHGLNAMIFVGNIKGLCVGRPVTGVPTTDTYGLEPVSFNISNVIT